MTKYRPKTVGEAVDIVLSLTSHADQEKLRQMDKKDLFKLHFTAGMDIRNILGLNSDNEELLRACGLVTGDYPLFSCHPDDASAVIIEAAWERLQREPTERQK